jgi:hypothetical protein
MILDVWQGKELRADFSNVWQIQELGEEIGMAHRRDPWMRQEKRIGKDESALRQTRERIAESTLPVNYFIGTVRMRCGKISEIPALAAVRIGT